MKKIYALLIFSTLLNSNAFPQGCATIRNIIGVGQYQPSTNTFTNTQWQLNVSNRYYKAFRDFRKTQDLNTPAENESVNKNYSVDFAISRIFSSGWSLSLSLPVLANSRTASFEHGGPNTLRHTTHAFGMGDIRIMTSKWILKPKEEEKFNFQVGLGLKLPTGNYEVRDYFYRNDTRILAPVNPGIQLGDGGTGIITELNGYYRVNKTLNFYTNLYYMSSPQEQNGVSVLSGRTPSALQIKAGIPEASITDAYVFRVGTFIHLKEKLTCSIGLRKEGVPVEDLFGKSGGTRRPGYYYSIEPGITYKLKNVFYFLQTPINFSRSINQNVTDMIITEETNTFTSSPGGSANFQLLFGAAIGF